MAGDGYSCGSVNFVDGLSGAKSAGDDFRNVEGDNVSVEAGNFGAGNDEKVGLFGDFFCAFDLVVVGYGYSV
ncbi:MAG: hypothetical protein NWF04_05070 [Candidatus Bathyarchaeota archaeon]|nr:hypothetical protein [Candidatus Bathyarchaeota archaeon]